MADDRGNSAVSAAGRTLAAAAVVFSVAGVAACGTDESNADGRSDRVSQNARTGEKTGSGELRNELRPLTKRFDALGTPRRATWMSGTLGSSDVPGPSSYWIDAIVTLAPGDAAALKRRYAAAETEWQPDVVGDLRTELPQGPLLASDRLDEAFSESGFATRAFLDVASNRVVLTAKGQ